MLYQHALTQDAHNTEALLSLAEVWLTDDDPRQARQWLQRYQRAAAREQPSLNTQRRLAALVAGLGETRDADRRYQTLFRLAVAQPPSQQSAQALRDYARFMQQQQRPAQALEGWRRAMVAAGIAERLPTDSVSFTRLTRHDPGDDWLKRSIRSGAAQSYQQQATTVTLAHDYWGSSGTPGYSDLRAQTTMLEVDTPWRGGTLQLRADRVDMNAGRFSGQPFYPRWATCAALGCDHNADQRAAGVSVAVGWHNDTWSGDLGTTPFGFHVTDLVGGLSYHGDGGKFGYTVSLHRRPLSSSLLALAGQRDPNSERVWGGVRATGGGLNLSYDQGGANGFWSSLSADRLSGKNVADNGRVRWMTGYYRKLINDDDRRVTVGLTNMLWHYDKDLSDYSWGQGGYYSPNQYLSFSVPLSWRQRTANWSWELEGAASWSYAHSRARPRYPRRVPLDPLPDRTVRQTGSASRGVGYTLRALAERRLTPHWFIGAGVDVQQAKDYTPSHATVWLRYAVDGWAGDMPLPPQPLIPYADW